MRKLTTLRKVNDLQPIKNADLIELATVDGWNCIVKKGEFEVGDVGVYFEIDSMLPSTDERFSFLAGRGERKVDGIVHYRIRTMKMRGEISQGLVLPVKLFPEITDSVDDIENTIEEREDFSEMLGIVKYERPEPQAPNASGNFPSFLKKTDEERIQNIYGKISEKYKDVYFTPTLKLDGSSTTIASVDRERYGDHYSHDEESVLSTFEIDGVVYDVIVCSRNLQIKKNQDSHFIKSLLNGDMVNKIEELTHYLDRSVAISGECMGMGIQGNPENFDRFKFFAFNIWDIEERNYVPFSISVDLFELFQINMVPILHEPFKPFEYFSDLSEMLKYSDGKSINAKNREGIVYKSDDYGSFKVISNKWLLDSKNA